MKTQNRQIYTGGQVFFMEGLKARSVLKKSVDPRILGRLAGGLRIVAGGPGSLYLVSL